MQDILPLIHAFQVNDRNVQKSEFLCLQIFTAQNNTGNFIGNTHFQIFRFLLRLFSGITKEDFIVMPMVTIKDIAQKTGVTATTVSRVINNRGYISDATREKVCFEMRPIYMFL